MLAALSSHVYGRVALARRRYYATRPHARVRLQRPVISIGSLAAGGSGKTPAAAAIARFLIEQGERPAILSRGYARRVAPDGVTIVSDGQRVRTDLDRAGDEPLWLARSVPGASVLVCPDRHLAGVVAERRLGASVHLLDDGFQHVRLERDINLLIVDAGDVRDPRTLPAGRLREPLVAARAADAVIAVGDEVEVQAIADRLCPARVFRGHRIVEIPQLPQRVLAVAGIARPEQFFEAARRVGADVAGTMAFRDHHAFTSRDVSAIVAEARRRGAGTVLTTEKDLIRLRPFRPFPLPVVALPLRFAIEPADAFRGWIRTTLDTIRSVAFER